MNFQCENKNPKDTVTLEQCSYGVKLLVNGVCWCWLDNQDGAIHLNNPLSDGKGNKNQWVPVVRGGQLV